LCSYFDALQQRLTAVTDRYVDFLDENGKPRPVAPLRPLSVDVSDFCHTPSKLDVSLDTATTARRTPDGRSPSDWGRSALTTPQVPADSGVSRSAVATPDIKRMMTEIHALEEELHVSYEVQRNQAAQLRAMTPKQEVGELLPIDLAAAGWKAPPRD